MSAGRHRRRNPGPPWWSQWPAALLLGLGSAAMVLTCVLPLVLYALLVGEDATAGTDLDPASGPGLGWRIFYLVLSLVFLALPVATVWSARRRLLGFLLWALVGSGLVMGGGLWVLGIL